ncbi:protein serine/threonine phosphatase 2C [Athelia psychrophila]|uniref:Protein serine/threonine phosphatase 2C n=1 Tax=Athelia psychrophila TaxID=1759441 RepID=A0A166CLG2_9AGAM|nr:protein serine/threonine phosphatase 2C [Fibularhizoctonia sp. CBS 109695]
MPLAYSSDIPGNRCGPEDGPWPRPYTVLDEPELWRELAALAKPQSVMLDRKRGWRADAVNFQPSPTTRTQDRYVVQQLDIHGHSWTLTGVFDGHLGDITAEHTAYHLPIIIRDFLREAMDDDPQQLEDPDFISDLLSHAMTSFDDAIAGDVLDLFPGGLAGLANLSDDNIRHIINDIHTGGANFKKARLCMYGTTALVALVDPDHKNLWVANLGDCAAVMVTQTGSEEWKTELLTTDQNGDNPDEVDRVRREHPGEPDCVSDHRVLGAIAPFRCIGDTPFKQPPEFTRRILYNLYPGFQNTSPWEEFLVLNHTPPYISAIPEITHRLLNTGTASSPIPTSRFLILSSDGLSDLCTGPGQQRVLDAWSQNLRRSIGTDTAGKSGNIALRLLWQALGGDDGDSVSRVLTLEMDTSWIDDTSIVVQSL